ncbi:hypothetical protein [Bacillus sp. AFS031507]|nr:hypothetical protein [Bacillus sp. AFS031507]
MEIKIFRLKGLVVLLVTAGLIFHPSRASYATYGYHWTDSSSFTGIIRVV